MAVTVDVVPLLDEQALADAATRIRHTIREAVLAGIQDGIKDALQEISHSQHLAQQRAGINEILKGV